MTASLPFVVPTPFRHHPKLRYRVQPGDTLERIAERFGLSGAAYAPMVGANLERGLTPQHVAPGYPLKLAQFRAGDLLRVPITWTQAPRGVRLAQLGDEPGADTQTDAAGLAIMQAMVEAEKPGGKDGVVVTADAAPALYNMVSQWWRQEHPGVDGTPSWAAIRALLLSALTFGQVYGKKLTPSIGRLIPWSSIPWRSAVKNLRQLAGAHIAWPTVTNWANANVKPGMVHVRPDDTKGPKAWAAQDWNGPPWSEIPWGKVSLHQIPAWAIPWGYVDFEPLRHLPQGASPEQGAQVVIAQIAKAIGLPPPDEAPKKFPGGNNDATSDTLEKDKAAPGATDAPAAMPPGKVALSVLAVGFAVGSVAFAWRAFGGKGKG